MHSPTTTRAMTSATSPGVASPPPGSGLTPEDVARAREAFRRLAPPAWKGLLDAPPAEPIHERARPAVPPQPIVQGLSL